ncbi:hypothetical protein O181_049213 [Austropuccinia psidii MF-1]|uniref:Uncharacterized protein n=1 Tax=Austropuccinia psidii MF-1 TaxID=1389203 RepID=A0A9Q3HL69_9BASI|nr:hypothetical protein [Austropuccinia psidii MF-1]
MINSQGVVKRLRRIADPPTNTNAEGSDELDGEEVEVVPLLATNAVLNLPGLLLKHLKVNEYQVLTECFNQSFPPLHTLFILLHPLLPLTHLPWIHQGRHLPFLSTELLQWSPPVEEEKITFLCCFPPPKWFRKGKIGLCGLPVKDQMWKMKAKMLWPC